MVISLINIDCGDREEQTIFVDVPSTSVGEN
jgi:hypothetical protein